MRKQFWRYAKACFEVKFVKKMEAMEKLDKIGSKKKDLLKYPKQCWCRAYFKEHAKCDIVENNMCDTFNSWIFTARHKSVITILEEIKHKIMKRQCEIIEFSCKQRCDIAPMARLALDENKDATTLLSIRWNASNRFQVVEGQICSYCRHEKTNMYMQNLAIEMHPMSTCHLLYVLVKKET